MSFDPDEYLASTSAASSVFDPAVYLAGDDTTEQQNPLSRAAQLTGRAALEGVGDIADIAASPFRTAMNIVANPPRNLNELMVGRPDDPFKSGAVGKLLTEAGVAAPASQDEELANRIARAMTGAGAMGGAAGALSKVATPMVSETAQFLAAKPAANVASAGISTAASEMARQSGASPGMQLLAGVAAPVSVAGVSAAAQPLHRRVSNILSSLFTEPGVERAAVRMATDVAGDTAPAVTAAMRAGEPPMTAAQAAVPAGSQSFAGLERLIAPFDPESFGKKTGEIVKNQISYLVQGRKDLNAVSTPIRDTILKIADNSGRTNATPILNWIDSEVSNPSNTGNTALMSALRHYRNLLEGASDPQTGAISATQLYGIRKNAGLALEALSKKEQWDKKVTGKVTKDIQNLIDGQIVNASGIRTASGDPAWKAQYLEPFSAEMKRLGSIPEAAKVAQQMGSEGRSAAQRISRIGSQPDQISNVLDRRVTLLNSVLRHLQGYGGERSIMKLADLMKPENKVRLAQLMDEELARRAAIEGWRPKIGRAEINSIFAQQPLFE